MEETVDAVHATVLALGFFAVVVAGSALARRLGILAPVALVVIGLVLSLVPGLPVVTVESAVILIGVLPPLLYVAALQASVPAFRVELRPILFLAIGLVVFTTLVIGFALHAVLPQVPLAASFAFAAAIAPPDAVAATAIARRIGLPRRLVTILEGESLFNDATALVLFRVAVAAALGATQGPVEIGIEILLAAGGGIAVGALGAVVFHFLHSRATDPLLDNAISLLTPFAVALVAESVRASAVVAVVVTGLYLGHRRPTFMSAASRLQMDAFWGLVAFVLQGAVFLYVGLQLRDVLIGLTMPPLALVGVTAGVLIMVILVRFACIYPLAYLAGLVRPNRSGTPMAGATVVGWAGMRGFVTLAAALALPPTLADGAPYPRHLLVWLAFAVIMGTLLLQSTTLPAVARLARVPPDDSTQDALAQAATQHAASQAAREVLERHASEAPADVVERLRLLTEQRANTAWERLGGKGETPSRAYVRLRRRMLEAERKVFREARDAGRIPEEVLVRAQREMDLEESLLQRASGEEDERP